MEDEMNIRIAKREDFRNAYYNTFLTDQYFIMTEDDKMVRDKLETHVLALIGLVLGILLVWLL